MMNSLDEYLTETEAAAILGVERSTLSRWSHTELRDDARRIDYIRSYGIKLYLRRDVERLRDQLQAGT